MWIVDRVLALFRDADPLVANRRAAVARACAAAKQPARYKLGAGGRDPLAKIPHTVRDGVIGSDCVGFTSWCLGHDRYQPKTFPRFGGWINTDSLIADARNERTWYERVSVPAPGDVVVSPSTYKDGRRVRLGHIGLVVSVPDDLPPDAFFRPDRRELLARVQVVDCAAAASRGAHAVAATTAAGWARPDAIWARCVRAP